MYAAGEDLIIIDECETKSLTGISLDCEVNIALAVKALRKLGYRNVIFALGNLGSAVVVANEITFIDAEAGEEATPSKEFANAVKAAIESGASVAEAVSAAQKEIGRKK